MWRTFAGCAVVGALLVTARWASADDAVDEDAVIKEGVALRRAGRDAAALDVFERALAVHPSPRARAQVGLARQALGRWVDAEADLLAALSVRDDLWIERNRDILESALSDIGEHLAWLIVAANTPGTELRVNGVAVGSQRTSPMRVPAVRTRIEAHAGGYKPRELTLDLLPGTRTEQTITLEPALPEGPGLQPNVIITPEDAPVISAGSLVSAGRGHRTDRSIAWASFAAAVTLGAATTAALIVRETSLARYNDDGRCFYGGLTRDQRCGDLREVAATAQTVAIVTGSALVVAGGTAIVSVALTPGSRSRVWGSSAPFAWDVSCKIAF